MSELIMTGLTFRGHPVCFFEDTGGPTLPSDMDFIYLAKNFDGTKVVNAAPNSTFGDYLAYGTITSNGSGASCYLSNGSSRDNYLYKVLTTAELNNIMANATSSSAYTFFFRMMTDSTAVGGMMSTRAYGVPGYSGDHYNYMVRCENNQIQFHGNGGVNLGSDFMLNVDRVYKLVVAYNMAYAYNLDTSASYTVDYLTTRNMSKYMTTFWAGYQNEATLARFYGFAGIPRQTTAAEDEAIKNCLMNQSA